MLLDKPTAGRKDDQGKLRWDLLPIPAVSEIIKVLTSGSIRYGAWNWAGGIDYSRVYAAALRHLTAWWDGEDLDPDSNISHLAHAGCCILFLLTYSLLGYNKYDDRPDIKAKKLPVETKLEELVVN